MAYAQRKRSKRGESYTAKSSVSSRDKSGMFAALLIQFHILLHLGSDSEIKQIPNVCVFIHNTN